MREIALTIGGNQVYNPAPNIPATTQLGGLLTIALTIVYTFLGIILFVMLLWGALGYLFSGGDKAKIAEATKRMTAALIGFVVTIGAFLVTEVIKRILPPQF